MKTLKDVQVGDTVLQFYGWNNRDTKGEDTKVVKVSRTHIHLYDGTRYRREDGVQTGTEYAAGRIYPSREVYEDTVRMEAKWNSFTRNLNHRKRPDDLTEQELDQLMERFGVTLCP